MKRLALFSLIAAMTAAGYGPVSAQAPPIPPPAPQAPAQAGPPPPAQETAPANQPYWPPGLDSWNSQDWDPPVVDPNAAERLGLTGPDVQSSQTPNPTEQGTRAPEETEETATTVSPEALYQLLAEVRRAPPGIDGTPIPRPNPLGSEPTTEMTPTGGPDHLFPEGYIE